ncbi:hypothetical protein L3Q67_25620 [Saccharothrix sp. AJ9571]|nr:hypothetical protein L3Q67_25620 [Saccharothrix sp. AJ9571]
MAVRVVEKYRWAYRKRVDSCRAQLAAAMGLPSGAGCSGTADLSDQSEVTERTVVPPELGSPRPVEWKPGHRHWRVTTSVAVASVMLAAVSATAAVVTATRARETPKVVAEVNLPEVSGNPGVAAIDPAASLCTDDRSQVLVGWGPERPMFGEEGSAYIGFNSVKSNSNFGDERAFYGARDESTPNLWRHKITAEREKTYRLRIYVHNGSSPALSAEDTLLKVNLPTCAGRSIGTGAFIGSRDAFPAEVYDGVTFQADETFNLVYVEGSAVLEGNALGDRGLRVSGGDFLTARGLPVGTGGLDGKIIGGYGNSVYFSFLVRTQFAN